MFATHNPTFFSEESHNYTPEDLEAMRQAFTRACEENPLAAVTETQRDLLAKAILSIYQRHFSQGEVIAAALRKVR